MSPPSPRVVVLCDQYPELSETFIANEVAGLRRLGVSVRVEALSRAAHPAPGPGPDVLWEAESTATRARAMLALAARHPLACLRDVLARRRWRREEPVPPLRMLAPAALRVARERTVHVHAHFAAGAALAALRIARVTGVPFSVTAHAYDIFQRPANLAEKLRAATFATSGCAYNVAHLRAVAGPAATIEEVVMGVDPAALRREAAPPGDRRVTAVGRLVEKMGFGDLVEACALLARRGEPVRLRIAGDGPLRDALAAGAELLGPLEPAAVRALLEDSDVLAMPCVVAADGDRDSMPVVVKEALAMELPVVGTDEVGLPEVIRDGWGRLVPPGDPEALADALAELLALAPAERAAMGRAGRAHVIACCSLDAQAARMLELITGSSSRTAGP
jgi:colanic acid/amylovoran biosynthesis glycosyltransferase